MPLPAAGQAWPPVDRSPVTTAMYRWSAWYSGDPSELASAYGNSVASADSPRWVAEHRRTPGLRGALQRMWWGRPINLTESRRDMIHIPIAADICQASADLLFADPPKFSIGTPSSTPGEATSGTNSAAQDRLNELTDDGFFSTLAEGAEVGAALGGVYLRVAWDKTIVPDRPFATVVHADAAVPTFMWGRLTQVTFWTAYVEGNVWWRHLEHHETNDQGVGFILHGLFEGNAENLGQARPLTARTETAGFVESIDTMSPGLAVEYIPNQRPQRKWRNLPAGVNLGRSDLDGIEGLMDALDETYASWMRDVRLAKARLVVSRDLLVNGGPGQGQIFDAEQEIYSSVNAPADMKLADGMSQVQFAIRVAEHQQTAQALVEQILRTAGYSSQTFGEGNSEGGSSQTATEVENRQQRSLLTRDRKIRLWRPGIARFLEKLLAVDAAVFNTSVTPVRPEVNFPDGVQDSQLNIAQTAAALRTAEAASTKTLVAMVHPDWTDEQITEEVALIESEKPELPDPTAFGDPTGNDPTSDQPST